MADSKTCDEVQLRFDEPRTCRALILEDDGRVAYAYLLEHEELVGDVWLYNVSPTPEVVDWQDQSQMPFLNPQKYCKMGVTKRLRRDSAVGCVWDDAGVNVSIDGVLMARLEAGAKPGWCQLATRPGPLAKPLETDR